MTDFLTFAQSRYSVRKFKPEPVRQQDIDLILRAGQIAPTGCNYQPYHVYVLQSEEALAKMRRCTKCHFDAPLGMLVCSDTSRSWKRKYDGADAGWVDASIVTTHMMLQAHELGVGSCWVMYFIPEAVKTEFELPDHFVPVALLVMGYPAEDVAPNPLHDQTRPMEELATIL